MNGISPDKARLLAENRVRWHLGFNDPTFGGWAVTGGYAVAALVALLAWRRAVPGFERRFWGLVCALLIALAINKQLDLHILLIDMGRAWAVDQGYYQQRRAIQIAFTFGAGMAGFAVLAWMVFATRPRDPMVRLALLGLVLTAGYVLLRAAAFNHADSFLKTEIAGMRWDWLVELAGIALIGFAAWRYRSGQSAGTM